MNDSLEATLIALEKELHEPGQLDAGLMKILHPDFVEFGRSGRTYEFADVVAARRSGSEHARVYAQDFKLRMIGESAALLTYKSARFSPDGRLQDHALRMSVWVRQDAGWQILFHQGTPTLPFRRRGEQSVIAGCGAPPTHG